MTTYHRLTYAVPLVNPAQRIRRVIATVTASRPLTPAAGNTKPPPKPSSSSGSDDLCETSRETSGTTSR